jgi:hypothetical protein
MFGVYPTDPPPPIVDANGHALVPVLGRTTAAGLSPSAQPLAPIVRTASAVETQRPAIAAVPTEAVAAEPSIQTDPVWDGAPAQTDRFFGGVEYVLFWMQHNHTPALVQVLPPALANFSLNGGSLPPGAATTVYGRDGTDPGAMSGVRVFLGMYFDDCRHWGIDASYLQLFQKGDSFAVNSPGVPVIGRDFLDVATGTDTFLRYTTPDGLSRGFIRVDSPVQFDTFDVNLRAQGPSMLSDRVDYFTGFRYMRLRDAVTINSGATILDPTGAAPPFTITSNEAFRATNTFYGWQTGLETHYRWGCWNLELIGKFAAGWVRQEVNISGQSTTQLGTAPPIVFPNQSILFVQKSNAGSYHRDRFAVLPEFMANLGYQITPHIRATIGYDVLTLSSIERSGTAIDSGVNPQSTRYITVHQASTAARPGFAFSSNDDWWLQGLTAGLEFNF